jgi:hypothetical protein
MTTGIVIINHRLRGCVNSTNAAITDIAVVVPCSQRNEPGGGGFIRDTENAGNESVSMTPHVKSSQTGQVVRRCLVFSSTCGDDAGEYGFTFSLMPNRQNIRSDNVGGNPAAANQLRIKNRSTGGSGSPLGYPPARSVSDRGGYGHSSWIKLRSPPTLRSHCRKSG